MTSLTEQANGRCELLALNDIPNTIASQLRYDSKRTSPLPGVAWGKIYLPLSTSANGR